MTKRERYIRNQEAIKTRAIYKLLQEQKKEFVKLLEKQDKKALFYTKKGIDDDIIDPFLENIKAMIPEYLFTALPKIMQEGAREPIQRYKELLPDDYALAFDIETEPASQYLTELEDLHLSQKKWSILRTTRDELRTIMANWIDEGMSYTEIGKQILENDPFVFSKARAKTIAVNEIGRAYWWANHEPARVLQEDGYVMEKSWQSSDDDKVRPTHKENEDDGWIPFDDTFSGTGDQFAPSTEDINCRCTSTHRVTGISDWKSIHAIPRGMTGIEIKKIFENLKIRV